ncbi:MAG TPA: anti-sigma factor [Verrucomicrobiae bacterium]|jgi:anti-sigma-K factor RskA|nr:anti-sigma factor [Verrucomicrobiae bacterium]
MSRDELDELAAGYAVGALDAADRARFETLLRGDEAARRALRRFEETLVRVAAERPEPPPAEVKAALMARIPASPRVGNGARAVALRPRRSVWTVVLAGAMAAGVAAIAVGLAVSSRYEQRLEALGGEARTLKAQLDRQASVLAILRDPATQMVALGGQSPSPGAHARMLWHEKAGGLLVAAGLPAPPPGKAYQLWAIAGTSAPVSAGVFTVDPKGTGSLRVPPLPGVSRVDVFAVTLEPEGGAPAPTGAMYLAGKAA